jgi:hypothetical protein
MPKRKQAEILNKHKKPRKLLDDCPNVGISRQHPGFRTLIGKQS